MSEKTNQPPAAGDSQESKKQTVRISLPPKPAASPKIKISVPPAGAAKAASTIKIPVPPKKTAPAVATKQRKAPPATSAEARRKISVDDIRKDDAPFEEESSFEAKPRRQKARVKKAVPADNTLDIVLAALTAVCTIGLVAYLANLGELF